MTAALEIRSFHVDTVVDGPTTRLRGGRLELSRAELAEDACREPALASVAVEVVEPGQSVRVANVLDAVIPDVALDDEEATFPGVLGRVVRGGRGRRNRLRNVTVLSTCDLRAAGIPRAEEFLDSVVDMAGPGAAITRWAGTWNVVLTFSATAGATAADVDRAIRRATLRTAVRLGAAPLEREPDDVEELAEPGDPIPELPSVGVILQVGSEGPFLDTHLYGLPIGGLVPTLLDPLEVLGGALTNGAFDWSSVRHPTAYYQDNALVRELLAGDGERLRLAGVVLARSYQNSAFEKERSALLSARLAAMIGAQGVVCTTFSSGNSHTDTMLTVRECERLGIRTVAIVAETNGGLTDHVPEADCLVSAGNDDELVGPWIPERVVGAAQGPAGTFVPTWAYLGATSQMGDMTLTSRAA